MRSENRDLMLDLMDDQRAARRDATLLAAGSLLRRKRLRRVALRSFGIVAIVGAAAVLALQTSKQPRLAIATITPAARDEPKALSDDELLALFPNTPVALASLDNGKKALIFPRAGDEDRFVTKL